MSEAVFTVVRSVAFILAVAIAIGLQRARPHAALRGAWRVNGGLWLLNVVVLGVVCGACACTVALWAKDVEIGVLNVIGAPLWLAVAVTIAALDLLSYAWHRANHRLRFLWRFHQVHHSDATFTVSTGVRFHPGELLLSLPIRLTVIAALGTPVEGVVAFEALFAIANLVEHGNIDLPAQLERRLATLLITPALHRRHHSRRRSELNTNFGTIFSAWDRLLGTHLHSSSQVQVDTGLPGLGERVRLLEALTLPLRYGAPARGV